MIFSSRFGNIFRSFESRRRRRRNRGKKKVVRKKEIKLEVQIREGKKASPVAPFPPFFPCENLYHFRKTLEERYNMQGDPYMCKPSLRNYPSSFLFYHSRTFQFYFFFLLHPWILFFLRTTKIREN